MRVLDRGLGTGLAFGTGLGLGTGLAFLCATGTGLGRTAVGMAGGCFAGEGGNDSESDSGVKARGGDDVEGVACEGGLGGVSGGAGGDGRSAGGTEGGEVMGLRTTLFVDDVEVLPCLRAARFARIFARSESVSSAAAVMALAACFPKTCL
jgi:hypothetical protein